MFSIASTGSYIRYSLLASDPGLQQIKQGAKTVIAVVIALLAFRAVRPEVALFAGMSAGFLMQCTAGTARREKQKIMALMGAGVVVSVGLGSAAASVDWAKEALLPVVAFLVYYVRRFIPGKAMFPLFGFTLTLLATLRPGGVLLYTAAAAGGTASAFVVYFYFLPDETLVAFRHALDLFLYHMQRLKESPGSRKDLRVLQVALAYSQGEMEHLCYLAPELCDKVLADQYEALQVLTILTDIALEPGTDSAKAATVAFCRSEVGARESELLKHREKLGAI